MGRQPANRSKRLPDQVDEILIESTEEFIPCPDNAYLAREYEDHVCYWQGHADHAAAASYGASLADLLLFARHLAAYRMISDRTAGKEVLDLGCFLGYGSRLLSMTAKTVTAVDMDESTVAYACGSTSASNVNFVNGDATSLGFRSGAFDAVIAFQLLEHMSGSGIDDLLDGALEVLRPGGELFLVTPNRTSRLMPGQKPFNPEHVREFNAGELRRTLAPHGSFRIRGVTAPAWIVEVETARVQRSAFNAYLKIPAARALKKLGISPMALKTGKNVSRPAFDPRQYLSEQKDPLLDSFILTDDTGRSAMDLFAVCVKA